MSGNVTISLLDRSRQREAIKTTSRAFAPDPLFGFFARTTKQEQKILPVFLGSLLRDARRHGEVHGAFIDGTLVGSASWLPPTAMPRSYSRELRVQLSCGRALIAGRNRRTGIRLLNLVDDQHPNEPHWYLALLGVEPSQQGHGLGSALLKPVLERCDTDITPAYLETQKPENLPFYERFGFRVLNEVRCADSPPVWLMWRDPDPSRTNG